MVGQAAASPIISPASIIKTLKNLAGKIGKRNAQVGGYSNYGGAQQDYGGGFSDGTNFGQTFVDFGVSSGSNFDGASCTTTYEQQCSTVNEQQCSTVNEQQCRYVDQNLLINVMHLKRDSQLILF